MSLLRYVTAGVAGLALVVTATAESGEPPNLKDSQMIAAGRELFQTKQCAYCHGADGKGGVQLADRNDLEPTQVFQTIAEGRLHGSRRMPSWGGVLTEAQIWQATAYIMSLCQRSK
jgi:mono/diheme cytochrome c family protein